MTDPTHACESCGHEMAAELEACSYCGHGLAPEQQQELVPVFVGETQVQAGMVRSILEGVRIPAYTPTEYKWLQMALDEWPEGAPVVVPESMLERAQEVLCASGVACKVEPGEVDAVWKDHVAPGLGKGDEGASEIVAVLGLNNKEVVARILERVREERAPFLETLLLAACRDEKPRLAAAVARTIDEADVGNLPETLAGIGDGKTRAVAATALAAMSGHAREAVRTLVALLEDDLLEVRDAAIEGLFSLVGEDLDYEPDAPADERAEAVQRWKDRVRETWPGE